MPPIFRSSLVNLRQINFQDFRNSLTPEKNREPDPELLASIAANGILHPPILKEQGAGPLEIVSGRRRLLAARQTLGSVSAICLVLPVETDPAEALAINLTDTMLRGRISVVEKAIFLRKILEHLDEKQVTARFLPLLDLEPHRHHLHGLVRLLELEEPLLYALHEGRLPEGVARELLTLSFTERLSLHEVMESLDLSFSNRKKITAVCRELATRHNISIMALLGGQEVREILTRPESNIPQKTAALMQWLNRQCFPRLNEAEQEFRRFSSSLRLPAGVTLAHSPSFEEDRVQLTIPFTDRETLEKLWPELAALLKNRS